MTWKIRLDRGPEPTADENALEEAQLLERDILNRELDLIDQQHKIMAQRAKQAFIITWLQRDKPQSFSTGQ